MLRDLLETAPYPFKEELKYESKKNIGENRFLDPKAISTVVSKDGIPKLLSEVKSREPIRVGDPEEDEKHQEEYKDQFIIVRYLVKSASDFSPVFGKEGKPGATVPSHGQMAKAPIVSEAESIAAGNAYFDEDGFLVALSDKSGDFRHSFESLQFAILSFIEAGVPMRDTITLLKTNDNGKGETYIPFSIKDFKKEKVQQVIQEARDFETGPFFSLIQQLKDFRRNIDSDQSSTCGGFFACCDYSEKNKLDAVDALLNLLQNKPGGDIQKHFGVLQNKRLGTIINNFAKASGKKNGKTFLKELNAEYLKTHRPIERSNEVELSLIGSSSDAPRIV